MPHLCPFILSRKHFPVFFIRMRQGSQVRLLLLFRTEQAQQVIQPVQAPGHHMCYLTFVLHFAVNYQQLRIQDLLAVLFKQTGKDRQIRHARFIFNRNKAHPACRARPLADQHQTISPLKKLRNAMGGCGSESLFLAKNKVGKSFGEEQPPWGVPAAPQDCFSCDSDMTIPLEIPERYLRNTHT